MACSVAEVASKMVVVAPAETIVGLTTMEVAALLSLLLLGAIWGLEVAALVCLPEVLTRA